MDNLSRLTTHYLGEKLLVSYESKLGDEPILTAASDVQKYGIWPVLPQFEDAWIRGRLRGPKHREPEPPNARIWEDLNTKHSVTTPWIQLVREQRLTL